MPYRKWLFAALAAAGLSWSAGASISEEPAKKDATPAKKTAKLFHAAAVEAFERIPGFGYERMPRFIPMVEDIVVEWSSSDVQNEEAAIKVPALARAHEERVKTVGTDPPSRLSLPLTVTSEGKNVKKGAWQLRSIDLVAVVDRDEPIVYLAKKRQNAPAPGRPQPGQPFPGQPIGPGAQAPLLAAKAQKTTREPDILELAALDQFRDGDDLFVRAKSDVLRMIGPLRASKQCLKCHHDSKEGDLFGAFSYTLYRLGK